MSEDTSIAQSHAVLPVTSRHTPPRVLSSSSIVFPQRKREGIFKRRVASIDLRIGLKLLGENGRLLFAEYIKTKSQ